MIKQIEVALTPEERTAIVKERHAKLYQKKRDAERKRMTKSVERLHKIHKNDPAPHLYRLLWHWVTGFDINMDVSAKELVKFPFVDRGEAVAKFYLYRILFLPGLTSVPKAGIRLSPRREVESWSADLAGAMYYYKKGHKNVMSGEETVGGVTVLIKHKFNPADIVVYIPTALTTMFEDHPDLRQNLKKRGFDKQKEVLVRSKKLSIPSKDITILKTVAPK